MESTNLNSKFAAAALWVLLLLGWFAIGVQFYLYMGSKAAAFGELLVRFFSFFTILTNLLVALCCTSLAFFRSSRLGKFFSVPQTQTAIAVYIVIVGLIYNTILRFLWQPEGWQKVVDELLHSVIPVLFVVYWLAFVPKKSLRWGDFWIWLAYPLAYLAFIMVRGSFGGYYPYPFVDLNALGFFTVMVNCLGITLLFVFFSLLFIGIGKLVSTDKADS
jgi:hypothetical protein